MQIVLTASASYRAGETLFRHGARAVVDDEFGARLLATGLFDVVAEPSAESDAGNVRVAEDGYQALTVAELLPVAEALGVEPRGLRKAELIAAIRTAQKDG